MAAIWHVVSIQHKKQSLPEVLEHGCDTLFVPTHCRCCGCRRLVSFHSERLIIRARLTHFDACLPFSAKGSSLCQVLVSRHPWETCYQECFYSCHRTSGRVSVLSWAQTNLVVFKRTGASCFRFVLCHTFQCVHQASALLVSVTFGRDTSRAERATPSAATSATFCRATLL